MEISLGAANLKLRIDPSEDVIVEGRSYASRFVLQTLDELRKETEEMDDRLALLTEVKQIIVCQYVKLCFNINFFSDYKKEIRN